MVAVDVEMRRHHGSDLERYILTLMAIVRELNSGHEILSVCQTIILMCLR
jgi:CII-binding regulator of phage lambda lysogenization HflD